MENMKATPLDDEALEDAAGGYLQVSKWVQYVSGSILPPLYNLASSANGNDKDLHDFLYRIFRLGKIVRFHKSLLTVNGW